MRTERKPDRVGLHRTGNRDGSRHATHLEQFGTVDHAGDRRVRITRRAVENLVQTVLGRVADLQLEEKRSSWASGRG